MLGVTIKFIMLNGIMLSVTMKLFMLNVIMLSVVMLNVVAPMVNINTL
jgi:hypothetical protein